MEEEQLQQQEATTEVNVTDFSHQESDSISQEFAVAETLESDAEYHTEQYVEQHHKEDVELDVSITTQIQEETYVEVESEADVEAAIERGRRIHTFSIFVENEIVFSVQRDEQLKRGRAVGASTKTVTTAISIAIRNSSNLRCSD